MARDTARLTVRRVLFVCSRNRLRSPTAEQVFASWPGIEVASAGVDHDADVPVTADLLRWAETILVMEDAHRAKLQRRFRAALAGKRIVNLRIPDVFAFMDPRLVTLLHARTAPFLPPRPAS